MLTFNELQNASASRCRRWHTTEDQKWSLLEWAGAMCGEAGEAANVAKKIKRMTSKMKSVNNPPSIEGAKEALILEAADTIVYAFALINEAGGSVEEAVRMVFNTKSEEYNFPETV